MTTLSIRIPAGSHRKADRSFPHRAFFHRYELVNDLSNDGADAIDNPEEPANAEKARDGMDIG
jgi:hypothetical protein